MTALGALKSIALVDGLSPNAIELIEVVAEGLGVRVDVATLEPVEPEAAARAFPDARWRSHVLHAQVVAAAIDGAVTREELEVLRRFEVALGIRDPWVKNVERVVAGNRLELLVDLMRRLPTSRTVFEAEGLAVIWQVIKFLLRLPPANHERAWRFKRLGLLPTGTLGRAYWEFTTSHRLPLSGEIGGIPYAQWHHDALHLLTGYDTSQEGEMLICAFYAGWHYADRCVSRRRRTLDSLFPDDPFTFFFMPLCTYHLGMKIGGQGPTRGLYQPRRVLEAMRRGAACRADLNHCEPLWEFVELPIDEVRRRLNIEPEPVSE